MNRLVRRCLRHAEIRALVARFATAAAGTFGHEAAHSALLKLQSDLSDTYDGGEAVGWRKLVPGERGRYQPKKGFFGAMFRNFFNKSANFRNSRLDFDSF